MNPKRLSAARWIAFGSVLLFGAAGLVGCGGSYAKVTGTVKFKGTPLPSGKIEFIKDGSDPGSADITDGTYTVQAAPIGECTVTVVTAGASGSKSGALNMDDPGKSEMMKKGGGASPKKKDEPGDASGKEEYMAKLKKTAGKTPFDTTASIAIPIKYSSPQSSGLKYTLKRGTNQIDIDLTD